MAIVHIGKPNHPKNGILLDDVEPRLHREMKAKHDLLRDRVRNLVCDFNQLTLDHMELEHNLRQHKQELTLVKALARSKKLAWLSFVLSVISIAIHFVR